ncbi:uncharacterized protein ASPGLDRAFT_34175 [Aspergillus glaucus CBS 516.65]|uniref:5'-3' DNA helicase ZGRF1-like N-terminal domain-containing protein n=1 Tax=Aspergillus glaucus CBS 516.65 TaxID=1160497 RepID=A0A1L9VNC0_ASPGL|nr:hypothetical protein ASPGLDRAFT_34175 [Aspergillus glaucus CBS 516.65]OJJ85371.1 hypothetical protein ASPGLDRAFT_34175 [Aspergillus glaucus CBS 516.65]
MVSSSPSLTVPLTQSTAQVFKFRCLFTHDLRRKAKRWQDGFVRYHTFNKRVMVFDDQGNFVGDLHWRQEETIQDGDELELDKGVLIQVGESMEKTETDLSPLFERRKASQTSPSQPSQSQTRNFPTRSSQPSSQSSRSLNDLLGIRRTPIERFRSPSERPPPRPVEIPEGSRPAKRQKTVPSHPPQRSPVIDLSEPSSVRAPAKEPTTKPTSRPERAQPPHPRPAAPARPTPTPSTSNDTRSKPEQTQQRPSENALPSTHFSFSSSSSSTPRNTLQLSREKPRKKLMYCALLPGQTNTSETGSDRTSPQSEQREPQGAPKPVAPDPVPTDVQMTSGDSTLDVLAEMIEDSPFESDVEETNAVKESSSNQATKPAPLPNKPPRPAPPDPCPEFPPAAVNHAARSQGIPPAPAKQSSRGFQKSYSDPAAFHTVNSIQSRQLPSSTLDLLVEEDSDEEEQTQDRVQEQGPWTVEALDLFDFWPPERPKPV